MRRCATLLIGLLAASAAGALAGTAPSIEATGANPEVRRILDAYRAARPTDAELGVFTLDWAGSLTEAKRRAKAEKRPIFFVSTTQLEDAGDLRGGHC